MILDKKEMASVFNKFFATIGSKLRENFNFSDTEHNLSLQMVITLNFLMLVFLQSISQLDNNKATGLDGINVRALKLGSPIISFYLSHLFNLSLSLLELYLHVGKRNESPQSSRKETLMM